MTNDDWRQRSGEEILQLCRDYTLFNWASQGAIQPKVIAGAKGPYFWDADGNRFLDFTSQLMCVNAGHQHPRIVEAIVQQAQEMAYMGPVFAHAPRAELGRLLVEMAPGDLRKVFFTLGGGEANELAMAIARAFTGRHKFISRYRSFHGQTFGSGSLTGESRRWTVEPGVPGTYYAPAPYCYRCDMGQKPESCNLECARYIGRMIEYEGPEHVAAVVLERVVGANGILLPERDEYLPLVRRICDEHDVLLMVDEVMSGFGRTGEWFAVNNWDVVPDIMTLAKGLTSAHLPLSAVMVSDRIARFFDENPLMIGLTYSATPVCCAAAIAAINVLRDENLIENSRRLGEVLAKKLAKMQSRHPSIGDVRGIGLFYFVELVKDRATKETFGPYDTRTIAPKGEIADLQQEMMKRGVWGLNHPLGIPVAPPLCITEEQLLEGLRALEESISITTDRAYTGS